MGVITGGIASWAVERLIKEAIVGEVLPESLGSCLGQAFLWSKTPQGYEYWNEIRLGIEKWSFEDTVYLTSLIDCEEPKTEDIQWA